MTPQLHAEMTTLIQLFYSAQISEEEWALLQVHMAYCDDCHHTFLHNNKTPFSRSRFPCDDGPNAVLYITATVKG